MGWLCLWARRYVIICPRLPGLISFTTPYIQSQINRSVRSVASSPPVWILTTTEHLELLTTRLCISSLDSIVTIMGQRTISN